MVLALTWLCVRGTEMSAKFQRIMVGLQVAALMVFVVAALYKMATGDNGEGGASFSLDWFNPVGLSASALISGMLLGVFCYWGWESAVNLNEESEDTIDAPGRAGVVSTIILLFVYLGSAVAVLGMLSLDTLGEYDDDEALFGLVGEIVLGPLDWVLILSIIISGLASTQTTILPASRGSLSMAVSGAFPDKFKEVHPEYGTPAFGTWVIGAAAIIWYVVGSWISQNFLFDSLSALSIVVAFDYGLTGPAGRRSRSSRPTVPSPPVGASPRSSSAADGAHRCPSPSPPRPRPTGTAESRRVRRTSHSASTSSSASSSRPDSVRWSRTSASLASGGRDSSAGRAAERSSASFSRASTGCSLGSGSGQSSGSGSNTPSGPGMVVVMRVHLLALAVFSTIAPSLAGL